MVSDLKMKVLYRRKFKPPTAEQMRALGLTGCRVSRKSLPGVPTPCPKKCIYAVAGTCDDPRINKGNGDSYCHRMNNKDVLAWLIEAKQKAEAT